MMDFVKLALNFIIFILFLFFILQRRTGGFRGFALHWLACLPS
jgi:hypothetical protein